MDNFEVTVSDGEETYVLGTFAELGWFPYLRCITEGKQRDTYPLPFDAVRKAAPFPTPYACLEALFRAVVTELFGVKA